MKEKISALSDAELDRREQEDLFRALRVNRELCKTWERYHLMRAAIRRELDVVVSPALADRIAQRIHSEPNPSFLQRLAVTPSVRSVGGLAVAASVAALAIVGLQWALPRAPLGLADADGIADARQVAAITGSGAGSGQHDETVSSPEWDGKLNTFVVQHHAFSRGVGMNGLLSYARVAGNSGNQVGNE